MRWKMEILQQFANLKLNFLVLTKELYVNFEVSKLIRMYPYQTGRSVLLGDIHSMVQKYIKQLNNRRSVINKAAANATAHGLLIRYPNLVGEIDVCPSFWAQSLLPRMDFKKRHLYHFPLYGI